MKLLFWGFIVKNWNETDFSTSRFRLCNEILVKLCVKYYEKCWKHCNKALYNPDYQRKRIKEWYKNEKEAALQSEYLQVKKFALSRLIALEQSSTKLIKKWIYCLRKIKSRLEKYSQGDIRCYFEVSNQNLNNNSEVE